MADKTRAYIDSCCFIDLVKQTMRIQLESDREKDVWHIKNLLQAHRDGEIELFVSAIAIAECTHVEGDASKKVREQFTNLLMSGQYLTLVQPTPFIVADARDLRWGHGLIIKGADAIHVASAINRRCEEFITTDKQVTKLNANPSIKSKIRAVAARNTRCLPDKYRQLRLEDADQKK